MEMLETENNQLKGGDIGSAHVHYNWEVTGFTIPGPAVVSPTFAVGGFEFKLELHTHSPFTSLSLHITKGWKATVTWEFHIINANDSSVFLSHSGEYDFERLMATGMCSLPKDSMRAYFKDGEVTVRVSVSVKLPDAHWTSAQLLT